MDANIGYEIRILNNLIRNLINNTKYEDLTVTRLHSWIIGFVFTSKGPVYQRDVETEFGIRRSTATNILSSMEANDLIRRESVEHDGRLKRIVLTDKAVSLHKKIIASVNEVEKQLRQGISEEELSSFFSTIRKIENNAQNPTDIRE